MRTRGKRRFAAYPCFGSACSLSLFWVNLPLILVLGQQVDEKLTHRSAVHRGIGHRSQRVKAFCLILGILRPVEWIFEIIFCILSSCHVLVPAFLFCNLGFLDYRYIVFSSLFCCTKIPENGFSTTTYSKHIQFSKFESSKKNRLTKLTMHLICAYRHKTLTLTNACNEG